MVKFIIVALVLVIGISVHAEEAGKAISEASPEKGIMLSNEAKKNIGLQTIKLSSSGSFSVPKSCLVYTKDRVGVYRFLNNWLTFVPVKIISKNPSSAVITSSELTLGTDIVSEGAALVRVSEMEAFAGEE